jgi:hypothetical protein
MSYQYLEMPLADELFECIQGPFAAFVTVEGPLGESYRHLYYHTYSKVIKGPLNADNQAALRESFEVYLRRLRAATPLPDKPRLFWRFRKGEHILLEQDGGRNFPKCKLYTRLVVPDCTLVKCPICNKTEGEPHNEGCDNIVRKIDG